MHPSIYNLRPEERPAKFESDKKGKLRERAFIHAWQDITAWPEWMTRAPTKSSRIDDEHFGIDAYFHTDFGDIPIQVKGSARGFFSYIKQAGHIGITVVVVNETDTPESIRGYTCRHIEKGYRILRGSARKQAHLRQLANT